MSKILSVLALSALFPLIGALGCGSEAGVSPEPGQPNGGPAQPPGSTADPALPGSVSVQLVDGPLDRFKEVNIEIQKVEINDAMGGWTEIGAPNKIINLPSTPTPALTTTWTSPRIYLFLMPCAFVSLKNTM